MGLLKRRDESKDGPVLTIFHAADIHIIPIGSHAVRQTIVHYQPLLSLHGRIHESHGSTTIGRTVVINPGSEYDSGRLLGVLVSVTDREVGSRQFVAG
jgi:Icc-related predicted phosphoesterase